MYNRIVCKNYLIKIVSGYKTKKTKKIVVSLLSCIQLTIE